MTRRSKLKESSGAAETEGEKHFTYFAATSATERELAILSNLKRVFASASSFYVVNNQIKVRLRLDIIICST